MIHSSWAFFGTTLVLFFGYYGFKHVEVVPVSGRQRVNWMPKLLEDSFISGVDEYWLSETAETRLPSDSKLQELVVKVGNRLTKENGFRTLTYHVCENREANAFVTPGGHVFVLTGMIKMVENADELAIILGHEMSHKFAKHSIDDIIINIFVNLFRLLVDYESNFLNTFSQVALTLPYSRNHEREADHMGLIFAAKAGFDPRCATQLWTRMAHSKGQVDVGGMEVKEKDGEYVVETPYVSLESYLSTHPSDLERINNFRPDGKWMMEAMIEYEKYWSRRRAEEDKVPATRGFLSFTKTIGSLVS